MDPLFDLALTLKAANRYLEQVMNEALAPLGITAAQADALVVIGQTEPVSLKDLGLVLIAEAGHPSRLVDRLVAAGWVNRRAASDDRRRIEVSLTASGERMRRSIEKKREQVIEFGRGFVSEQDLSRTLELFSGFLAGSSYAELLERRRQLAASSKRSPQENAGRSLTQARTAPRRSAARRRAR